MAGPRSSETFTDEEPSDVALANADGRERAPITVEATAVDGDGSAIEQSGEAAFSTLGKVGFKDASTMDFGSVDIRDAYPLGSRIVPDAEGIAVPYA